MRPGDCESPIPGWGEEEAQAVGAVVRSGWLSAGPLVPAFEQAFARLVGVRAAVAFANGTVALHAMLRALEIGLGDEVIVPAVTFVSTVTSVVHAGARPVFADVQANTLNLDPEDVRRRITRHTRAIVPVHYGGQPADMEELQAIATSHDLVLLEDAAQAHGSRYRDRAAGALGRAAMFSFTPNKTITTGEGGLVTTDDEPLAERLRMLRNHGSRAPYLHEMIGFNYRMTEMQAAIGLEQLKRLPAFLEGRGRRAEMLARSLGGIPGLELPCRLADRTHPYQLYSVQIDEAQTRVSRDEIARRLAARGIQTRVCFPPLHRQPIFANQEHSGLTRSERAGPTLLTLPSHNRLTDDDVNYLAECVATACRAKGPISG